MTLQKCITIQERNKMSLIIDGDRIKLRGALRWASVPPAKPKKPHEDAYNESEPDNCFWSIEVECTEEEHKKILACIGKKPGQPFAPQLRSYDEDVKNSQTGEVMASKTDKKFITIKKTKIKGSYDFGDIAVRDRTGKSLTDVGIANDSTGIVHIDVEPVKKGSNKKTLRLRGVQVIDLIPFEINSKSKDIEVEVFDDPNPFEAEEAASQDLEPDEDFGFE